MTTTVKAKNPRNGVTKKPTPKSKAHARRLNQTMVADENRTPSQTSTSLPDGVAALDSRVKLSLPVKLDDVADLRCDWLARHPANRVPAETEISARAISLREEGQLEPLVVREWEDAQDEQIHFQIISGETRWLAAQQIGWTTIACRVVKDCDDARALELLAHYNGERTDLNPMQRAQLIQHLCSPVEEGGAGNTREEAARAVGLNSGSAASNLVRLLELPQVWQDRVANGELPESFARLLLPLCKAPRLLKIVEEKYWKEHLTSLKEGYEDDMFNSRGALEDRLDWLIDNETRPTESGNKHRYGYEHFPGQYQYQDSYPVLFEMTDEIQEKLEIVELPVTTGYGKKAKTAPQMRATNTKLYDKLQVPAIKKHVDGKAKKKANSTAAKDEKPAKKKLTAAEQKKLDKERAEKLTARIEAWRHRWLCEIVAREIEHHPYAVSALIAWMITERGWPHHELKEVALEALQEYQGEKLRAASVWPYMLSVKQEVYPEDVALRAVARYALLKPDRDPKWLKLKEVIDNLAARCSIDLEREWTAIHHNQVREGEKLQLDLFLGLHTADQLDALGDELDVYTERAKGKAAKADLIAHNKSRLPMPKSIRPLEDSTVEKKTPAKKGAARKKAAKKK